MSTKTLLNTPNSLTLIRLLTAPLIAYLIIDGKNLIALAAFALAGFLDKLDGVIARRWNQITEFGAIADPIVDKVWLHTINICLLSIGAMPLWVVAVFISRDFIVAELRGAAKKDGGNRSAKMLGKLKLRFQVLYSCCCIATLIEIASDSWLYIWLPAAKNLLLIISLYFTLASLIFYAKVYTQK